MSQNHSQYGIVLLITLSVLLLLSITISDVIQDGITELKLIANNENQLKAEILARSAFRQILMQIKEKGVNSVFKALKQMEVPVFPLSEDIMMTRPEIISLDHYMYINNADNISQNFQETSVVPESTLTRGAFPGIVFNNYLQNLVTTASSKQNNFVNNSQTEATRGMEIDILLINQAIGSLYDWTDVDNINLISNEYVGAEYYPTAKPQFSVKNAPFDLPTELKIIPALQELGIFKTKFGKQPLIPFSIYSQTIDTKQICPYKYAPLNVNLLPSNMENTEEAIQEEIINYLNNFRGLDNYTSSDNCFYRAVADTANSTFPELIAKYITDPLKPSYEELKEDSNWESLIIEASLIQINAKGEEKDYITPFFTHQSKLIAVRFFIEIGTVVKKELKAYLYIPEYKKNNPASAIPKTIEIVYFTIN